MALWLVVNNTWLPTASIENLRLRAAMLANIRKFFADRNVLEVETPLLSQHSVTDVYIESFVTEYRSQQSKQFYYLQTSPEYAMKRLLAAGSGAIYQICKSFRNQGEFGRQHNPEFSMLEWYRPGFDHHQLMNEMDELLQCVLGCKPAIRKSYQQLFLEFIDIDPLRADINILKNAVTQYKIPLNTAETYDYDCYLQLLLAHLIEPKLGLDAPFFLYDFPRSQAALAKIRYDDPPVAERFEVYIEGVELANGFHELADAQEQLKRFQQNQLERQQLQLPKIEIDERLIAALEYGLPACAGVALGLDRLLMILAKTTQIKDVVSFDWERA